MMQNQAPIPEEFQDGYVAPVPVTLSLGLNYDKVFIDKTFFSLETLFGSKRKDPLQSPIELAQQKLAQLEEEQQNQQSFNLFGSSSEPVNRPLTVAEMMEQGAAKQVEQPVAPQPVQAVPEPVVPYQTVQQSSDQAVAEPALSDQAVEEPAPEAKTLVDSILDSSKATLVEPEKEEAPVVSTSEDNHPDESQPVATTDENSDEAADDLEPELDEEVVEEEEAEEEKVSFKVLNTTSKHTAA